MTTTHDTDQHGPSAEESKNDLLQSSQEAGEANTLQRKESQGDLLWEQEVALRKSVSKGVSGNLLSSFLVNGYSAILIFVFHLISLESLLSIALSVSMTICEYSLWIFLSLFISVRLIHHYN